MNIIYPSLVNALNLFKENVVPALTTQQKKILVIASLALSCLAACYVIFRCFNKKAEIKASEPILPEILEDEVSKRHPKETYTDSIVIKYAKLDENLIKELASELPNQSIIINTGLTDILHQYAFTTESINKQNVNNLLTKLVDEALIYKNENARLALTRPNNFNDSTKDFNDVHVIKLIEEGFPQNTPLALLVKANNLEGAKLVLSVYQVKDLLFTTPRGNNILHLAIATAQGELVLDIMKRAKELGILGDLLSMKNIKGFTASDLFSQIMMDKKDLFANYLTVINPYLGGDEINKAGVYHQYSKHHCRTKLIMDLMTHSEILEKSESPGNQGLGKVVSMNLINFI